jgi:C1A family cysteine protease
MMAKIKPNRVLLVVVSIVACLILLVSFGPLPSRAAPPPTQIPQVAPLNPDFLNFIQNRPAQFYGYIPPPVDMRHLWDIPVKRPKTMAPLSYPATFDWRTSGKVTPVKNQDPCGTCWIFGTTSVLESAILIGQNISYDFSEQSVALCVDRSWVYLYDDSDEPCGLVSGHGGGNSFMASEVFIKKGAILESCNSYNASGLQCDGTCVCDSCTPVKVVDGYRYVTGDQSQTTLIKQAVYDHGPVTVAFYYDAAHAHSDPTYGTVYDCATCTGINHLVSIIGWDDGVPHFETPGAGAWLVKNSWGTSWGNNGYFWLAYNSSCMTEIAYLQYKDNDPNEELYYWDEAGWVNDAGYGTIDYAWMANVFTMTASGTLTHVDFWATSNNAAYNISIYQDGNPANGLPAPLTWQNGTCLEAGYYSIALTSPVSVTAGLPYTIAVKMTTPGWDYPLPIEYVLTGTHEPPIQTGVSYMSPDGTSWTDIGAAPYKWNACLRARVSQGLVSVAVTPSSIAYGTVALGTSQNTTLGQQLTVTNNGTVTEDFSIKSSNATRIGGTNWTLVTTTPGNNEFKHEFSTNSGSNWTALMTGYQSLASGIAPNATQAFDLQITMPDSTTDYLEHTIIITILAVAAG